MFLKDFKAFLNTFPSDWDDKEIAFIDVSWMVDASDVGFEIDKDDGRIKIFDTSL